LLPDSLHVSAFFADEINKGDYGVKIQYATLSEVSSQTRKTGGLVVNA
jgi:hypothetical protein